MDYFKRSYGKKVGVGGWHCSCCGPRKGEKRVWRRFARRKDRQHVFKTWKNLCGANYQERAR